MDIFDFKRSLKSHGLNITAYRLRIFKVFISRKNAITQSEIEQIMDYPADRVTLYRTLKAFEENGIIHRIIGTNGIPNFALSHISRDGGHVSEASQHLHFSCIKCKNIFCLDDPALPNIQLPDSYKVHSLSITIIGICRVCNKK